MKTRKIANLESEYLDSFQKKISDAIAHYMRQNKIGLNELVRQLNLSTSHVIKIQKAEANLTLATLARIAATIHLKPEIRFKNN